MSNHRRKVVTRLLADMQEATTVLGESAQVEAIADSELPDEDADSPEINDQDIEHEPDYALAQPSQSFIVSATDGVSAPPVVLPETTSATERPGGWVVSVAFWLFLIVAAGLYAAAALAAPLLESLELEAQQHAHQQRLIALENHNQQLQKTIHALKTDPRVAEELARQDFHALRAKSADERIPVDGTLTHAPGSKSPEFLLQSPDLPWYAPLLKAAGKNQSVNTSLLICAASLVLYAFGFLRPS